ncbi:MAG: class II fumarate hydratase [Ruminiclostridium sp.]|nr:class II fumarate hydratase [Ruminiclostridium sp.]MCI9465898.1 class II fumarate hydratase [Ruminiclostridium sp.]
MDYRMEHDTMGEVAVPADRHWGAQTQRSLENFPIGEEKMPPDLIRAFALLKLACAAANRDLGKLDEDRYALIERACQAILDGELAGHFPLSVWQTGSGTQTNMNCNEVIAHYGNDLAGAQLLHPNDHVNMSQSSNDTFPTALHLSAVLAVRERLLPALERLTACLMRLEGENRDAVKTGRTHLQDAVPITFAQEISGWRSMVEHAREMLVSSLEGLYELALGGTAVGTGLNAPAGFAESAAKHAADLTGYPFRTAPNKFHALTAKDALVFSHGALKALAANLMKLANDVRWLASGPRCGLGEIFIPENEPGSSIMPGKVNPTQCEALTMVAVQVMGNDAAVGMAASQGNFELNVYMPLLAYNYLQSVRLLADGVDSFTRRCLEGLQANREKMAENLHRSLMTVTALTPLVGYENGAKIAKKAHKEDISLKEAAVALGLFTPEDFDAAFHPEQMI